MHSQSKPMFKTKKLVTVSSGKYQVKFSIDVKLQCQLSSLDLNLLYPHMTRHGYLLRILRLILLDKDHPLSN